MSFHIVMSKKLDLGSIGSEIVNGLRPRHSMVTLSDKLGCKIHFPQSEKIGFSDRTLGKLVGSPDSWAMARRIVSQFNDHDVVYATGEDVGFPLAVMFSVCRKRTKLVVFVHNLDRPKLRLALRIMPIIRSVSLFVGCASHQTHFLSSKFRVSQEKLRHVLDTTDLDFFSPGQPSKNKTLPVVVSVGLEQRDYRTLAEATSDLPVDVRISGFSADAVANSKSFPDQIPRNMSRKFYSWLELRQLYRDADVVVVSTFPTTYAAGVQALMEGTACGRPIVVSQTEGLADYLKGQQHIFSFPPGDKVALRSAIKKVLETDFALEDIRASAERYNSDIFVGRVAAWMRELSEEE